MSSTPGFETPTSSKSNIKTYLSVDEKVDDLIEYFKTNHPKVVNESGQILSNEGNVMSRSKLESAVRYLVDPTKFRSVPPGVKRLNDARKVDPHISEINKSPVIQKGNGKTSRISIERWKF
jgi:hypothetical protein